VQYREPLATQGLQYRADFARIFCFSTVVKTRHKFIHKLMAQTADVQGTQNANQMRVGELQKTKVVIKLSLFSTTAFGHLCKRKSERDRPFLLHFLNSDVTVDNKTCGTIISRLDARRQLFSPLLDDEIVNETCQVCGGSCEHRIRD
jgi:hypothetical protein